MRIAAVLILLFSLSAGTASAGGCILMAEDFRERMNEYAKSRRGEKADSPQSFGYLAFVIGVSDGLTVRDEICTEGVAGFDIGDVVVRRFDDWMKANSALPSQTCASDVVSSILMKRFPCDAKAPAK